MDQAIWAIVYDISEAARAEYMDWFHGEHMPEKLARPGYVWAAHYHLMASDPQKRGPAAGNAFLALFAGASSRVFFDPTLSELKARQDDLTRRMIGCRSNSQAFILAEEWRQEATHKPAWPVIDLDVFEAQGADEAVGAWCVKEVAMRIAESHEPAAMRKLMVAQGPARHAVLLGFDSVAVRDRHAAISATGTAAREVSSKLKPAFRFPVVGTRIWPAV